ncbi:MAG: DUF4253 domain-containing protein [Bryobacteraceae bacterium]
MEVDDRTPESVSSASQFLDVEKSLKTRFGEIGLNTADIYAELEYDFDLRRLELRGHRQPRFDLIEEIVLGASVNLVEVPCAEGWQVPAHLPFGDWNACPPDEFHCAILRRWSERYGAELVGMSHDVIELYVPKPIDDKAAAKLVAQEMTAYCEDIVTQGCGTVRALAQEILGAKHWLFWWD